MGIAASGQLSVPNGSWGQIPETGKYAGITIRVEGGDVAMAEDNAGTFVAKGQLAQNSGFTEQSPAGDLDPATYFFQADAAGRVIHYWLMDS